MDIEVVARSQNGENQLVRDRDEIISITGTTGKVYNMEGSKGTGVTVNANAKSFRKNALSVYRRRRVPKKNIVKVKLRRDGKIIDLKVEG